MKLYNEIIKNLDTRIKDLTGKVLCDKSLENFMREFREQKEITQSFNNIPKLEINEFKIKNELWSMKYDVE